MKPSKVIMHILAVGLNMLIVSGEKKSPEIQIMGSIGAGKLYLIALMLSCQRLQIPSYSHYHLNVLYDMFVGLGWSSII